MAIAVTLAAVGQPALAETVTPVVEGCYYSPSAVPTAESAADFARLTRQLQFDEAASVFSRSGGLRQSVIPNSSPII